MMFRNLNLISVLLPVFIILLVVLIAGCEKSSPLPITQLHGNTMGTTFEIKLGKLPQNCDLEKVSEDVGRELKLVTKQMSTWEADSEISLFNKSESTDWYPVSKEFAFVVKRSIDYHKMTEGRFDITVPPLLEIWNFSHDEKEFFTPPAQEQIIQAKELVNSDLIEVRLEPAAIKKKNPKIRLEVSAIAQGHGIDRVAAVLEKHGITNYMIEIGGEIKLSGKKNDNQDWRIAIEKPVAEIREIELVLELNHGCVGTSGNYRHQSKDEKGNHYSHIINPHTGKPVEHSLISVSVYTEETSLDADALTTSLMVMGPETGYNWAESRSLAAVFIEKLPDGKFNVKKTTAFSKLKEYKP